MKTSYFAKYKGHNAISIARGTPIWFKGIKYEPLAPSYQLIKLYQDRVIDKFTYAEVYNKCVLSKLNPQQVYKKLGNNAVLLCWEKPELFCHRHLVAEWFKNTLGIIVSEYIIEDGGLCQ